ncbi:MULTISPECIES: hypothetical protein [Klebsiella/Raoultella group]|uniref:hypothetical protein n=1 Tax=Klebsiella pneumoniae TaxID=573 RepID=UPI0022658BBE|nr:MULTISPECIES: hypothetical protein [Klebsiella/Raoultella group]
MIDGVFEPSETQLKMVMQQLNELNRLVEDLHLLKLADAGQLNLSMISAGLNEIVREKLHGLHLLQRKRAYPSDTTRI